MIYERGHRVSAFNGWLRFTVVGVASAGLVGACLLVTRVVSAAGQADQQQVKNSYMPVEDTETFATIHDRMVAAKAGIMKRQMDLLEER